MHWHEQKKHKFEKFSAIFRDTCHPSQPTHAILQTYLLCFGFLDSHAHQQTQELQSNCKSRHLKHCKIIALLATEKLWTAVVWKWLSKQILSFKTLKHYPFSAIHVPCQFEEHKSSSTLKYTVFWCTVKAARTSSLWSQIWNSLLQHILNPGLHQEW